MKKIHPFDHILTEIEGSIAVSSINDMSVSYVVSYLGNEVAFTLSEQ